MISLDGFTVHKETRPWIGLSWKIQKRGMKKRGDGQTYSPLGDNVASSLSWFLGTWAESAGTRCTCSRWPAPCTFPSTWPCNCNVRSINCLPLARYPYRESRHAAVPGDRVINQRLWVIVKARQQRCSPSALGNGYLRVGAQRLRSRYTSILICILVLIIW